MMDYEGASGMYRLWYPLTSLEITHDTRQATLTFKTVENQGHQSNPSGIRPGSFFTLRLDCFASFAADLRQLRSWGRRSRGKRSEILLGYLDQITGNREPPPDRVWRQAFGDLAFLLLRYAHKYPDTYLNGARALVVWLGARNVRSAWRLSYDHRLSFEHRYKLLKTNRDHSAMAAHSDRTAFDLPETKERELFWWMAYRKYELAREWCASEIYRNTAARRALRVETINYLHVLKDEPRQEDLRRFFSECGTDIESEVKRVLFRPALHLNSATKPSLSTGIRSYFHVVPRSLRATTRRGLRRRSATANRGIDVANDEVVRRAFFVWFLRRYDWVSALRLIFSGPRKRRLMMIGGIFMGVNALAGLSYLIQINEPALQPYLSIFPALSGRAYLFWSAQIVLQLGSLLGLLMIAPVLFRLLMPRGFFGSLLAWSTVILLTLKDLEEFKLGGMPKDWQITHLCHSTSLSDLQLAFYSVLISAGILGVGAVFVAYTVTQFTDGFWKTLLRTFSTLAFLIIGSLFWGFAFALPVKFLLERDTFQFDCHCVIPIVVIGSAIAVLFGLMVELIWHDQSIAEPLGEPP